MNPFLVNILHVLSPAIIMLNVFFSDKLLSLFPFPFNKLFSYLGIGGAFRQ